MHTIRQHKTGAILTAVTVAMIVMLAGCDSSAPTEPPPAPAEPVREVKSAVTDQSQDERCVVINGQVYCT